MKSTRLGHTSVTAVLDVYGHLYDGLYRAAADTLEPPWTQPDVHKMWTQTNKRRDTGRGLTSPMQGILVAGTAGLEPTTSAL